MNSERRKHSQSSCHIYRIWVFFHVFLYRASIAQKSTGGDDYSPLATRLIRRNRYRLRARPLNKYLPRKNSIASFSTVLFEYFSHLRLTIRAARMLQRSVHMLRMHSDLMVLWFRSYSRVGFYFHCSEQEAILRYPIKYQHNLFPFIPSVWCTNKFSRDDRIRGRRPR